MTELSRDSGRVTIGTLNTLELEPIEWWNGHAAKIKATLRQADSLSASVTFVPIPEFAEVDGLLEFVGDLSARYWTGWDGSRTWTNIEGDLHLEATWPGNGEARLRVRLRPPSDPDGWIAEGLVTVGNMELERLGRVARSVLLAR